jgi:hypothetical protein
LFGKLFLLKLWQGCSREEKTVLETGDFAFDAVAGANVQILEKIEAWGYISYRVFNPATGTVYKATEEQLNMDGGSNTYDENYLRYVTLLSKIKNESAGGALVITGKRSHSAATPTPCAEPCNGE